MEDQIASLRQIEQRQAAVDVSKQPIPQIPATSSSTWGALLRSTIAETIPPNVDRWRSGLDALFVISLPRLLQDEIARTNELLANLAEIIIHSRRGMGQIATRDFSGRRSRCPPEFVLVGVVYPQSLPIDKIVDIKHCWDAAEKTLGPAIEMIPQLLVVPVLLLLVASGISLFFIAGVVLFLACTLLDASVRPAARLSGPRSRAAYAGCLSWFHIVQRTHADDTLDKAAAALSECHLLSTEASSRCNRTATGVIVSLAHIFGSAPDPRTSPFTPVLIALVRAARRSAHRCPLSVLCILASQHVQHHDLLFDGYAAVCPACPPVPPTPPMIALFRPAFIAPLHVLEVLHHLPTNALSACTTAGLVVKGCPAAGAESGLLADLCVRCVLGLRGHERAVGFLFTQLAPILRALDTVLAGPSLAMVLLAGLIATGDSSRGKEAG
ncbi:hypothetical protein FB451DRAFT_1399089 [Mycena latifolia]|nr:hypothetical protein FB451DRAFT_1399089 [Mycena latifolia]